MLCSVSVFVQPGIKPLSQPPDQLSLRFITQIFHGWNIFPWELEWTHKRVPSPRRCWITEPRAQPAPYLAHKASCQGGVCFAEALTHLWAGKCLTARHGGGSQRPRTCGACRFPRYKHSRSQQDAAEHGRAVEWPPGHGIPFTQKWQMQVTSREWMAVKCS